MHTTPSTARKVAFCTGCSHGQILTTPELQLRRPATVDMAGPDSRQALAPELMTQLPEIPLLSERDKYCLRYGLNSVAPGFVLKQPLKGQLESFKDFCTREEHFTREHTFPIRTKTFNNIQQTIMQILGFNYKHNGVSKND